MLVGKPMISILLEVRTVYIHESPDKSTASPSCRRADLVTASGMTNRRVEARASVQQLELATNIPCIHVVVRAQRRRRRGKRGVDFASYPRIDTRVFFEGVTVRVAGC
jgi:hypothetical protein